MSEKPLAAVMTALVVAPLCAVCVLGPALLVSMIAGFRGWLSGTGILVVITLIAAAIFVLALKRRRGPGSTASAGAEQMTTRRNVAAPGGPPHERP